MRVESADQRFVLEVKRSENDEHASFELSCSVNFGHGSGTAKNARVHFLNLSEFAETLDRFLLDRSLEPTLNGIYDSFLKFSKAKGRNAVNITFAIGDAFAGGETVSTFRLQGSFEIDQERLNGIVENLNALARDV